MYSNQMNLSFEGTPLEILRRYGPYFIGAFASIAIVLLLYEMAFDGGHDMLDETNSGITGIVTNASTTTNTLISNFASP